MFCGGGGSSCGAVMAGAKPIAALDIWPAAIETYRLNFPWTTTYQMKASSLSPRRVLKENGKVDLLLASPECTSHSVAKGNGVRCDKSKNMAFEVVRFAKLLQPRWFVVENVIQMRNWHRFDEWYRKLKKLGYKIDIAVLDARYFDTPQSRRRLFIVGDKDTVPQIPDQVRLTRKTVRGIIGQGEAKNRPWQFTPLHSNRRAEATIERAERAIDTLGNHEPFIMVYYSTDGAGGYQRIDRPLRTVTTLDRFAFVRPNGSDHEMRMLQPPELAAAMGFPKHYNWPTVSRRTHIKLIGNAVCPRVMRAVVESLVGNTKK